MDYLLLIAVMVGLIFLLTLKNTFRIYYIEGMSANTEEIIVKFNNLLADAVSFVSASEMETKIAEELKAHLESNAVKEWDES
jgi:hypothetical protein